MSAGSSSTRFTPATAASSGSAPSCKRRSASSTARNPFAEELATGRPPLPWAWPVRATAATAAAVPSSLRLESLTRAPARRRARPSSAQTSGHGRGAGAALSRGRRDRFQALRAALRRRRRGGLLQERLGEQEDHQRDDEEVDHASGEIAVLDRILARERELRGAPLAAGKDEPDHGHQHVLHDAGHDLPDGG